MKMVAPTREQSNRTGANGKWGAEILHVRFISFIET